jgi:hypothetical protein
MNKYKFKTDLMKKTNEELQELLKQTQEKLTSISDEFRKFRDRIHADRSYEAKRLRDSALDVAERSTPERNKSVDIIINRAELFYKFLNG